MLTEYQELIVDWCIELKLDELIARAVLGLLETEPQQDAMIQWFLDNYKRELDYRDVLDAGQNLGSKHGQRAR